MFEASGDLLTSGSIGVWRWPVRLDSDRGEFRIGPPRQLPFPAAARASAEDRSGRIVALANYAHADVLTPERMIRGGAAGRLPLRRRQPGRAMAGDRQPWHDGAQVWRIARRARVADLPVDDSYGGRLQPRWEMADDEPAPVPALGRRHLERSAADRRRRVSVSRPTGAICWFRMRTRSFAWSRPRSGRTVARLESPDSCDVDWATFSPDGSRLVVTTNERPGRARLGPAGDPPATRRDGARLGRAGLCGRRPGRAVRSSPAAASGRPRPAGRRDAPRRLRDITLNI